MAHPVATREEHPWPARLMHHLHLASIVILVFTGFYISDPFFSGGGDDQAMNLMRLLHFIFMFVLIFVAVFRVYWAFAGASAPLGSRRKIPDYKFFGPEKENKGTLLGTVKYYLFLQRKAPRVHKYNGLQKGTYIFWLILIVLQAITGFAIWSQTQQALLPLTYPLGGPIYMRTIHYLIMWLFIITTLVHIYLSSLHMDELKVMFTGRESKRSPAREH